jgi:hypothetical protein
MSTVTFSLLFSVYVTVSTVISPSNICKLFPFLPPNAVCPFCELSFLSLRHFFKHPLSIHSNSAERVLFAPLLSQNLLPCKKKKKKKKKEKKERKKERGNYFFFSSIICHCPIPRLKGSIQLLTLHTLPSSTCLISEKN